MQDFVRTIKNTIANNRHIVTACDERGCIRRPPLDVEKRRGLTGIAGHYVLPPGISAMKLQIYADILYKCFENAEGADKDALHDKLSETLAVIEGLNPTLSTLHFDRALTWRVHDVILGVASAFNTDDIQFYIDGNSGRKAKSNPDYLAKWQEATQISHLRWVASPQTLDRIIAQHKTRLQNAACPAHLRCEHPFLS